MKKPTTKELMGRAFWEAKDRHDALAAEVQAIRDEAEPLNLEREKINAKLDKFRDRIKEKSGAVIEASREMSALAKALQNKPGDRPA